MTECKRNGCNQEAEIRPRYEGFCSLQCRDYHEYETEINAYKTAWRELREWLDKSRSTDYDNYLVGGNLGDLVRSYVKLMAVQKIKLLEKSHGLDGEKL